MAGFKGQAQYSVDSKGRVAIPAKMRADMNPAAKGRVVLTRGFEKCVFLYPLDRWDEIEKDFRELNTFSKENRRFIRTIMMWADEQELDPKQGRVTLPKNLMEFAGISDKALFIGALDHVEIWDPDVFDHYLNEDTDDYETMAERVMGS
jgi:MraZ protein